MSYDIVKEDVPPFVKRVGDYVIQGSNNTIVIMGTDRARPGPATISDGLGHTSSADGGRSAGCIHLIAGRSDQLGDPDMLADRAYMYLSMKTDVDRNMGLEKIGDNSIHASAAALKADTVRIVARNDVKISLDGGKTHIIISHDKITLEGKKIEFGTDAKKHLVRYEDFEKMFDGHKHQTPSGPSGDPIPPNRADVQRKTLATISPNEILVTG